MRGKSVVYFLQSETGSIKIGYTTNLRARIHHLKSGTDRPLKLLATVRGNKNAEAHIHQLLSAHRLSGEWFSPHPDVLEVVTRVLAEGAQWLPAECAPARAGRAVELRKLKKQTVDLCREYVYGIASPRSFDDTVPGTIDRVAQRTGLPASTIKAIIYRATDDVSAIVLLTLRKAFLT